MNEIELVASLDSSLQSSEVHRVKGWFSKSQAFREFCRANEFKIRHKINGAKDPDDQMDVLTELQFAFGISTIDNWSPIYEPIIAGQTRNPDFLVEAIGHPEFYLEVKRIREPGLMVELDDAINAIRKTFHSVPSGLSVEFSLLESPNFPESNPPVPMPRRLQHALPAIIDRCHEIIESAGASLSVGENTIYTVPEFDADEFSFHVYKESEERASFTECGHPTVVSLPYTNKESFKFSEHLIGALPQLHPHACNVLAIKVDSNLHEMLDLEFAVSELSKRARDGDNAFFKKNKGDSAARFLEQWPRLGAVVLKTSSLPNQANIVWRMSDAKLPLSNDVLKHLRAV